MPSRKDSPFPEMAIDDVIGCLQSDRPPISDAEMEQITQDMAAERYRRFIAEEAQSDGQESESRSSE